MLTSGNNLHHRAVQMFRDAGFKPNVLLMVEQFSTTYALCCAGLGISFTSTLLIKKSPEAPVSYSKLDSPLCHRNFNAITRKSSYHSLPVEAFLRVLGEIYQESCPV